MKISIPKNCIDNIIIDIIKKWEDEYKITLTKEDNENIFINNSLILEPINNPKLISINNPDTQYKWCYFNKNFFELEKINNINNNRTKKSIFHGKINTEEKIKYRSQNWKDYIENFNLDFDKLNLSKEDYFNELKNTIFGLCLKGDTNRSNHLLDYLGCGVIPLIGPNIDISFYKELIVGYHYFKIEKPEDISRIINQIDMSHLKMMSNECYKWYKDNCSLYGSYKNLSLLNSEMNTNIDINNNDFNNNNIEHITNENTNIEHITNENTNIEQNTNKYKTNIESIIIYIEDNSSNFINIYNSIKRYNKDINIISNYKSNLDDIKVFNISNIFELIENTLDIYSNTLFITENYILTNKLPNISTFKDIGLKKYNNNFILDIIYIRNKKCLTWIKENQNNLNNINLFHDIFLISNNFIKKDEINKTDEINIKDEKVKDEKVKDEKVNLFINYINDIERVDEFNHCIKKNLNNKYIDKIYCFTSTKINDEIIINNSKINIIENINDNINLNTIINFCNKNLTSENDINIIINSDIYLDNIDWNNCIKNNNIALCLSPYIVDLKHNIIDSNFIDTINSSYLFMCWVFKGIININTENNIILGSVNSGLIINNIIKDNNYLPLNLCSKYKIFNLNIKKKIYNNKTFNELNKYLLPNYDIIKININELFKMLDIDENNKYKIICDIFTKYIKIKNY